MYLYLFFTIFILPTRTTIAIPANYYFPREQFPSNDGQVSKPSVGWIDPRINGGRFLDVSHAMSPASQTEGIPKFATPKYGHGEPLNVIISANSDPFILTESGLHFYAK